MGKKHDDASDSTIENRVYLFESLASSYVEAAADVLGSGDEKIRARALRALGDLAYVSCIVADSGDEPAEKVRERVAALAKGGSR